MQCIVVYFTGSLYTYLNSHQILFLQTYKAKQFVSKQYGTVVHAIVVVAMLALPEVNIALSGSKGDNCKHGMIHLCTCDFLTVLD